MEKIITIKNKFIETIQEIMIKNNIFNEYGSINFIKDKEWDFINLGEHHNNIFGKNPKI